MRLRRNFSWTFIGNVVYAASQWAMLTILAKLGTKEMVGQFALGLAVAAPVITFTNLALRQAQATDAEQHYRFGDYLALRLTMTLLGVLVIAGITGFAGYPQKTALVVLMIGLAKACEAVSDVFYGLMQFHERMDRIAISMMLKGVLSLGALGLGVKLTGSVFWGAFGLAIAWLLMLIGYDIPSGRRTLQTHLARQSAADASDSLLPRWHPDVLRKLLRLTLPLGFATMFNVLSVNIPRYFVERRFGPSELGLFAAMAYVLFAGTTVVGALGQSASPRLARYFATGNMAEFKSLLFKLIAIAVAVGTAFILLTLVAGRPLLTLLYTKEYSHRLDVFLWLNIAATISYVASCLGYGLTAARNFSVQPYIYSAASLISVVACMLLIPRYGLLGSAWALLILNLAQAGMMLGCVRTTLKRQRAEKHKLVTTYNAESMETV